MTKGGIPDVSRLPVPDVHIDLISDEKGAVELLRAHRDAGSWVDFADNDRGRREKDNFVRVFRRAREILAEKVETAVDDKTDPRFISGYAAGLNDDALGYKSRAEALEAGMDALGNLLADILMCKYQDFVDLARAAEKACTAAGLSITHQPSVIVEYRK